MPRLAWFSPMPPARTGVALNSAEVVAGLRRDHAIDVFVDEPVAAAARAAAEPLPPLRSAHDFVWQRRLEPYDLVVYQLGNSSAHDYIWPYLFRYPGLAVLHDVHLHHARAATLLRQRRAADYRAELAAAHPDAGPDVAELAVRGFDSFLYYMWPMTRLVVEASKLTVVHSPAMIEPLQAASPGAAIEAIRLGHGEALEPDREARGRARVRRRYSIAQDAVVFGVFGGITPEKRVPQVLDAFTAVRAAHPTAMLLLAGGMARHYDVRADIRTHALDESVILTDYLDDELFTDCIAASDVCVNLRWPSAREVSGPWLRALAAGRPTITMDLWHTTHVPALDPRTWQVAHASSSTETPEPVTIAIDILDEDHSLRLAMRRLAGDRELRARLSRAAREYWAAEHSPARTIADYNRVIGRAINASDPQASLPAHLRSTGDERLRELVEPLGIGGNLWSTI